MFSFSTSEKGLQTLIVFYLSYETYTMSLICLQKQDCCLSKHYLDP